MYLANIMLPGIMSSAVLTILIPINSSHYVSLYFDEASWTGQCALLTKDLPPPQLVSQLAEHANDYMRALCFQMF